VNTASPGVRPAEVWGSTWIPGPSPIEGLGEAAGYALAFVRVLGGPMLQVVVDGTSAPAPGVAGQVRVVAVDDGEIDVFTADPGAEA
jgi:hypothetical protein